MWTYDKKLEYPVNIKNPNAAMAKVIITQFGGPDCKKVCSLFGAPHYSVKRRISENIL